MIRWCLAAFLLLLHPTSARTQDLEYVTRPDGCESVCNFLKLDSLLEVQKSGGDVRAIGPEDLIGQFPDRMFLVTGFGMEMPAILDEVVKITFDFGGSNRSLCTGVALGRDVVLTAGHCACGVPESYQVEFPVTVDKVRGSDYRFHDPRSVSRPPLPFFGYDCRRVAEPQPGVDLGLLFLQPTNVRPAYFSPVPPPAVPMTTPHKLAVQGNLKSLLVMGYGRTETSQFPRGLIAAFIALRDPFCLSDQFASGGCAPFREFSLSNLATSVLADTCDGDSGGPVYFIAPRIRHDGKAELHRLLVGVTSRGLGGVPQLGPGRCGGGGVYTAVAHPDVLKWLAVNGAPLEVWPAARHFARQIIKSGDFENEFARKLRLDGISIPE